MGAPAEPDTVLEKRIGWLLGGAVVLLLRASERSETIRRALGVFDWLHTAWLWVLVGFGIVLIVGALYQRFTNTTRR